MQHVAAPVVDRLAHTGRKINPMPLAKPPSTPAAPSTPIVPPESGTSEPASTTPPGAAPDGGRDARVIQVPGDDMRQLLSRFSYGVTEALVEEAFQLSAPDGDGASWFEQQLTPDLIPDAFANHLRSWWPHLSWTPEKQWQESQSGGGLEGWEIQDDFVRWTLLRRIYSKRQVLEVMSEFWSNLLHVPAPLSKTFPVRIAYDSMIRRHALGRYDDLLVAAVLHPAMLCYLDNAKSTKAAPNENLGRELLELHTVGHEAGIHQADVVGSTRILTGWMVDINGTWEGYYSPDDHYVGAVKVFGFESPNDSPDGRSLTIRYLRWLARRPETAERIALRLATRFVSDSPSQELIEDLAKVFRESGTDIPTTLRALVAHPEFRASRWAKVRTADDDLANTYRVMGLRVHEPKRDTDAAVRILLSARLMGQTPFGWPAPNGFPDASMAWSSASRVLGSWDIHRRIALGRLPATGVDFRTLDAWLPEMPCRFDSLVDHVARRILAIPATSIHIEAASTAVDADPHALIHRHSVIVEKRFGQLLSALLDTPEHMTR